MKLVASLIVRNELGRYLEPCIEHLFAFCDEVVIVNDGSTDSTAGWLYRKSGVRSCNTVARFFNHEGRARQFLLDFTMISKPTHILNIDADEFVSDGEALRAALGSGSDVYTLNVREVWKADDEHLHLRTDGGWRSHAAPILYRVTGNRLTITDRALACGREPQEIRAQWRKAEKLPIDLLHFGWLDESARAARHARYAENDGGKFHARAHLASILAPDRRVRLEPMPWPDALASYKDALLGRVTV